MKRLFKKVLFSFLFAWKNMRAHPFRTVLLMIGFLGVSMTILIAISMNDVLYTYYYGNRVEKYQDIDLIVSVNDDSDSRFFSTTPLVSSDIDTYAEGIYPFFEFDVLTQISEDDRVYVHVYASSIAMLSHITDQNISVDVLTENEVIITASYAKEHELEREDDLLLQAGDQEKYFIIKDIIEDSKIFSGHSIFIDKQTSFSFFLSALNPDLADFPQILLTNIYSVLYVDLKTDFSVNEGIAAFQSIPEYESLNYTKAVDEIVINQIVNRNTALVDGLLSLVFVAIIFVLQTTLNVYFYDRKANTATIHVLGGRYRYAFGILSIEIVFEQILSFILAVIMTNFSYKIGMNYLSSAWRYQLTMTTILTGLGITIFVGLVMFAYYSYRYKKTVDMSLIKRIGDEKKLNWKTQFLIAVISLTLYGLSYIPVINDELGHLASLFRIVFAVGFLLSFPFFIYEMIVRLLAKHRENRRTYYHLKILSGKRGFSLYFSMMLIVSLIVFLLVFMVQHLNQREDRFANEYHVDMIVTGMVEQEAVIYEEIKDMTHVNSAARADIYETVEVPNQTLSIDYVISMETEAIGTYFEFNEMDDHIMTLSQASVPAILLPMRYQEIFDYEIGDTITLTLDPDLPAESLMIVGFFDKQGMDIAFTNLYMINQNVEDEANSILVIAEGERNVLFNELLDAYSKSLVVVVDFQSTYVNAYLTQMSLVKNFIIGFIIVLMACFVMTLSNHQTMLNIAVATDHAKMLAIGYGHRYLAKDICITDMVILCVALLGSTVGYLLIVGQIKGLFAVFGAYESIHLNTTSILIGLVINSVFYMLMLILKIQQERKLNITHYLRIV